ncbi:FAD-dependent oxidoreductase [Kribbella solani]|uniref:NAD(P)/FAD-dependent oxidoreductase n=1 Tax=Kribbella solani TaxID=236067 RepID=UPI0029B8D144|nr:FAD-dependent oxidoreductase [Kribbella solani]MDX3001842.1 FAD-dependent oxidoreductase [Kribbella solani]
MSFRHRSTSEGGDRISSQPKVTVVGAGVIGLSVAHYLTLDGCEVTVLDQGPVGRGCSFGNGGWIVPRTTAPLPAPGIVGYTLKSLGRPASPVYLKPQLDPGFVQWLWGFWRAGGRSTFEAGRNALVQLGGESVELFHQLHERNPFAIRSGESLRVFRDATGAAKAADELSFLAALSIKADYSVLDGDEARSAEPILSGKVASALLMRGDLLVDPKSVCDALGREILANGGTIREHEQAVAFQVDGQRVTAVATQQDVYAADHVVIAAGSWSAFLTRLLGVRLPLQAGKGYSFTVGLEPRPTRVIDIADAKTGIAPHEDSTRVVGTMELSGLNSRIDRRRIRAMVLAASPYVVNWPAGDLDQSITDEWVGLRPMLPSGLPVIDQLAPYGNVFVSTGHAMMGVSLGLASGLELARYITSGSQPTSLKPFSLQHLGRSARFSKPGLTQSWTAEVRDSLTGAQLR